MLYTADQLSNMSIQELSQIHKLIESIPQKQKEEAWRRMDIGIYDEKGNLIGDKQINEDGYND